MLIPALRTLWTITADMSLLVAHIANDGSLLHQWLSPALVLSHHEDLFFLDLGVDLLLLADQPLMDQPFHDEVTGELFWIHAFQSSHQWTPAGWQSSE